MATLSEDIIKYIIDFCDIPTLFYLSCTNKELRTYINNKDWKQIWLQIIQHKKTAVSEFEKKTNITSDAEYKDIVRLAGFTGCMLCKKQNIRKVWWQFKIRSCTDCLYERTIGEWEFEDKIPKHTYTNLPYTTKQMYNKYYKNYTIKFYWKTQIDEILLLYPPPPPTPQTHLSISPKKEKIKKIPTTQEIENQKNRKEDINNICELNYILLTDAVLYSETYNKNIKISSKLQKKNFIESKLPEIKREIAEKKEEIRLSEIKLEEQRVENIRLTEEFNERLKIQKELYLMTKEDKRKKIANVIKNKPNNQVINSKINKCELCNNNRLFCINGLYDHKRDAHGIV